MSRSLTKYLTEERRKAKIDYASKVITQATSRLHDRYITQNNLYNFLLATIDESLLRPPNSMLTYTV
jgi:hypothetical protein